VTESKLIQAKDYSTKSQRYEELLQEGIEWIQKFSGNQWTDYNFHDPGITFLEQICFALTDLGYKSNFPIEDILFVGKDKFDLESKNLLYAPFKILPSSPLTPSDFRKLILDQIENIQNAWVFPEKDDLQNMDGLYHVKVQLSDSLNQNQIEKTLIKVDALVMQHRALATDFFPATSLKKDEIKFEGDIILDSFAVGEQVLAEIYLNIEQNISNSPTFFDYSELEAMGQSVQELYTGPLTQRGFLRDVDHSEKTSEIYISELKEIIYGVEGVQAVENLVFFKNGIKVFDNYIAFDNDSYPSLIPISESFLNNELEGIRFVRNETSYKIDQIILQQIYDSISVKEKATYHDKFENKLNTLKGRFSQKEFEKYFSIMRELPSLYGLKEDELPSKSSNLRKAQAHQLRAFLLLFDQLMANHISQLAHLRNFFSVDVNQTQTLFYQVPTDVPEIAKIIGSKSKVYQSYLGKSVESRNDFFKRKNKILDHLMARFGETCDTTLLGKIYSLFKEKATDEEIQHHALEAKIGYATSLLDLGYARIQSFDYTQKRNDVSNLSGIERRLKLKLNIQKNISDSVVQFLSKEAKLKKTDDVWRKKKISIEDGPQLEILALPNSAYDNNNIHFHLNNNNAFRFLFLNGIKAKHYTIVKSKKVFCLLFKGIDGYPPAQIFRAENKQECLLKKNEAIEKIKHFNLLSEGFYMEENLLLRPRQQKKQTLFIFDENKKHFMKSHNSAEMENLKEMLRDFSILAVDKKNYNVVKKTNGKRYEIILYDLLNKPLFRSCDTFAKEEHAKEAIPLMIQFFKEKIIGDEMEQHSEMVFLNDISNKFPNAFNYSNHINFILPNWPFRFQNKEFKTLIYSTIHEFIPAHLTFDIFYLNINQMNQFEQTYSKWMVLKQTKRESEIDSKSLQIIQMLLSYKRDGN